MRLVSLKEERTFSALQHVGTWVQDCLQTRERNRNRNCRHIDLRLPSFQNCEKSLLFKPPSLWSFVTADLAKADGEDSRGVMTHPHTCKGRTSWITQSWPTAQRVQPSAGSSCVRLQGWSSRRQTWVVPLLPQECTPKCWLPHTVPSLKMWCCWDSAWSRFEVLVPLVAWVSKGWGLLAGSSCWACSGGFPGADTRRHL